MRLTYVLLSISLLAVLAFAGTSGCVDGSKHWECSKKYAGQVCIDGKLQPFVQRCPCSLVPGFIQEGEGELATCLAAKCSDGTESGSCSAAKPKKCVNGVLVDNSTACGCPSGKRMAADGIFCEFIPCNDTGSTVPEGTCSPKKEKKCVNGALVDKASECGCPLGETKQGESCVLICSDGTEDGKCSVTKPKKCTNGYLLDDAPACGCPDGMNSVGKQCSASALGGLGGVDLLGGSGPGGQNSSSEEGGQLGSNALSCCCLPAALIGLVGGFAFFRKRN